MRTDGHGAFGTTGPLPGTNRRRHDGTQINHHSRGPRAQSQECRSRPAPQQPDRDDRPVGLGQVLARLRYHLRRRPAPLCRKPVGLCTAVSRDDAEARCRPDRRAVAGHLHRAEDHQPQPALDRRHGHRNLRLHAAAVRPRRRALFAGHRAADRKPDGQPDG